MEVDIESEWRLFCMALFDVATDTCETKRVGLQHGQKKTEWWTEEVRKAIGEKKTAYRGWIQRQTPENWQNYKQLRDIAKKLVTEAKAKSWNNFGHQLEYNHHSANKLLWLTIRRLYKGGQKSTRSVKDTSGRLLTLEEDIVNRWKEYFGDLYNSSAEHKIQSSEPDINESNDISMTEVTAAIKSLKSGKAAGNIMLHYKLVLTTVVLSIFFIPLNINAQNDKNELVQKLINEARQLNLKIDESKIVTRSIGGDGDIAAVPLITDSILNVTSEAIEKGEVYTSLQCMKTKKLNGCYRVRATGLLKTKKGLNVSLIDKGNKIIANSEMVPRAEKRIKRRLILIIDGPVDVYIDGVYYGTYDFVIIYI
ncbi:unnamed protein product [Rotaria sp. Silwood2]|nr:unnamed protein product [Rotaria sp. Silwood2]